MNLSSRFLTLLLAVNFTPSTHAEKLGVLPEETNPSLEQTLYICDANIEKRQIKVKYLKEVDAPPCEVNEVKTYKRKKPQEKNLYKAEWDGSFCKRKAGEYAKRLTSFGIPCVEQQ